MFVSFGVTVLCFVDLVQHCDQLVREKVTDCFDFLELWLVHCTSMVSQ